MIFLNFLKPASPGSLSSNLVALNTQRILDMSPIFCFASSNLKIFQTLPLVHRNRSSYQSAACSQQAQQEHSIAPYGIFTSSLLKIFSIFPPEISVSPGKTTFFSAAISNCTPYYAKLFWNPHTLELPPCDTMILPYSGLYIRHTHFHNTLQRCVEQLNNPALQIF